MKRSRYGIGLWVSMVFTVTIVLSSNAYGALLDCTDLAGTLTCGSEVKGNTAFRGKTNVATYGTISRNLSGKEVVYELTNPDLQDIVISLTGMTVDLDILLLYACDETDVVAWGDTLICEPQLAAGTYYVVIDGVDGAAGTYGLKAVCAKNGYIDHWTTCNDPRPPTEYSTTVSKEWHFYDGTYCRTPGTECSFAMYMVGGCGIKMYMPLYDVESANIQIFNYQKETYLDLYAESTGGWSQGPQTLIEWRDCTGYDPRWNLQTTVISFDGDPTICGVYRIDFIDMGGADWFIYNNCDGSTNPGYNIYDNFCDAWNGYKAVPELSIGDLGITGICPDYFLTFNVFNTGCIKSDVPVYGYSTLGGSNSVTITDVVAGSMKSGSMPLTVTSYGTGLITVMVDYFRTIEECSELGASQVPCYPPGDFRELQYDNIDCLTPLPSYTPTPTLTISFTHTPVHTPTRSPTHIYSLTPTPTEDCGTALSVPYYYDFEKGAACWNMFGLWHFVDDSTHPCFSDPAHPGSSLSHVHSLYYGIDTQCDYDTGAKTEGSLVSPNFLITADSSAKIWSWEKTENFSRFDLRDVYITDDGGSHWYLIDRSQDNSGAWYRWDIPVEGYSGKTVQLAFNFDSVDEIANNYPGWYLDDFSIEEYTPTPPPTATYSPTVTPVCVYVFNLNTNPGWTTEGMWEYGMPRGLGGGLPYAYPDPDSGCTGSYVYGYNLSGDYPVIMTRAYHLTTTPLDCTGIINTRLSFCRWLGIGPEDEFNKAFVLVSSDGVDWHMVWEHMGTQPISDGAWQTFTYDISETADNQPTVYLRWGIGPTSSALTYCGWNIDDIKICGDLVMATPTPRVIPLLPEQKSILLIAVLSILLLMCLPVYKSWFDA